MDLTFKKFKESKWLPGGRVQVRIAVQEQQSGGAKKRAQTVSLIFASSDALAAFARAASTLEPMPPGLASANQLLQQTAAQAAGDRRRSNERTSRRAARNLYLRGQ
jgi:hypothetical protein